MFANLGYERRLQALERFMREIRGDRGVSALASWTPAWTGLTVAGAPTYTGLYVKNGGLVLWAVGITAGGVITTASTAGTTFINNMPIALTQGCTCAAWDATNGASYGVGGGAPVDGVNSMFTPTWAATNHTIVISGFYFD